MKTNTLVTLYQQQEDETYIRAVVKAMWTKKQRMVSTEQGITTLLVETIFVPIAGNPRIQPRTRDYVVRGNCSAELSDEYTLRDLIVQHGARALAVAALYDYGSAGMQHWELGVDG